MYVEKDPRWLTYYRYYIVIETEDANAIVTQQLWNGSVTWNENPEDLEDRNSLAKTLRSKDCRSKGMTVQDFKAYSGKAADSRKLATLHSKGKRYATGAFDKA